MSKKFEERKFKFIEVGEDFDFDFDKQRKEWKAVNSILEKMYDGYTFKSPEEGQIVNATYVGQTQDFIMFDGNFKDYVRIENRPSESKYLKNTNIGDKVDVIITEVNNDSFIIKGGISTLYESRAHETLKSIDEDQSVNVFVRELTPAGYNVDILYEGVSSLTNTLTD
jgi:ribosomal protein S1